MFIITYMFFKIIVFILGQSFQKIENSKIQTFFISLSINIIFIILIYLLNLIIFKYYLSSQFSRLLFLIIILLSTNLLVLFFFLKNSIKNNSTNRYRLPLLLFSLSLLFAGHYLSYLKYDKYKTSFNKPSDKKNLNTISLKDEKRIINLYIEGLSFDFIFPLISEGKLPNFNWIMKHGAWGKLRSFSPTHRLSHKITYLTGDYPRKHHLYSLWIKSFSNNYKHNFFLIPKGLLSFLINKSGLTKNIFSPPQKFYIKTIFDYFDTYKIKYLKTDFFLEEKSNSSDFLKNQLPVPFDEIKIKDDNNMINLRKEILLDDKRLYPIIEALNKKSEYKLFFSYIDGLLEAEQHYYKYSFPEYFLNVSEDDIYRYGTIIEKYYQYIDQYIGKIIINMRTDDLLIINSTFGLNPVNPIEIIIDKALNRRAISATYENSKEGLIFFFGNGIKENHDIDNFNIINGFPIYFYYLGLPVPKKSHKNIDIDMFKKEFINENPIIFSYENGAYK